MRYFVLPLLLMVAALFFRCANPVTPTGGNKDITPPVITLVSPPHKSTNKKPTQITFKFDEHVLVSNAKEQIIISPKTNFKTEIKTGNNFVTIILPDGALEENTTYSVHLNECIKDLNENNQGTYNPVLFSTGNQLDTQIITGKCVFVEENKTNKVKLLSLSKPAHRNITDKSLHFVLGGLPQDSIYLLAFNDLNNNDSLDINEDAGLIKTAPGDSAEILIYALQRKKIGLYQYNQNKYGLTGIGNIHDIINFKDTLIGDSLTIHGLLRMTDSSRYIIPKKAERKPYKVKYILSKPSFLKDSFQQIKIVANEGFLVKENNTLYYTNKQQKSETCDFIIGLNIITFQFKNNSTGNISIPLDFETESKTVFKDTIKTSVPVYTSLIINNNELFEVYVTIRNKNTNEAFSTYIKPKEYILLWVLSGDHEISYYEDKNKNRILDGPDFSNKTPGEYYQKLPVVRIKENIAVDLKLKGTEKP